MNNEKEETKLPLSAFLWKEKKKNANELIIKVVRCKYYNTNERVITDFYKPISLYDIQKS